MRPTSAGAMDRLARLIGSAIPAAYVELLENYPAPLLNCPRGEGEAGMISQVELPNTLEIVLDLNREARAYSVPDPEGAEFLWPNSVLVIGETGAGDYYCLDASGEVPGVLQFEHQPVEFYEIADDLAEFVDMLVESVALDDGV